MSEGTDLLVKPQSPRGILNCQINLAAILQLGPRGFQASNSMYYLHQTNANLQDFFWMRHFDFDILPFCHH